MQILDKYIQRVDTTILMDDEMNATDMSEDKRTLLQFSLKAVLAALTVMSEYNSPKELVIEEILQSALNMLKHLLSRYIYPLIERTTEDPTESSKKSKPKKLMQYALNTY
jgi:hypothetical protein